MVVYLDIIVGCESEHLMTDLFLWSVTLLKVTSVTSNLSKRRPREMSPQRLNNFSHHHQQQQLSRKGTICHQADSASDNGRWRRVSVQVERVIILNIGHIRHIELVYSFRDYSFPEKLLLKSTKLKKRGRCFIKIDVHLRCKFKPCLVSAYFPSEWRRPASCCLDWGSMNIVSSRELY